LEDRWHRLALSGQVRCRLPGDASADGHAVEGGLSLLAPTYKEYAISHTQPTRLAAQQRLAGRYCARPSAPGAKPAAEERQMRYALRFCDRRGWRLLGYKRIRNDPGLDAWRDTTSLFCKLRGPDAARPRQSVVRAGGVVHVDLTGFLFHQIRSIEVTGTDDPSRIVWAAATFAKFFFGSLQRIYLPQVGGGLDALLSMRGASVRRHPLARGP